jgi:DNA polymerase III delta prime subunit
MYLNDEMLWVNKYRPRKIADCILPAATKSYFRNFIDKAFVPSMILYGTSGIGKTSTARALCDELGIDHIIINGSLDRNIDTLRTTVKEYASSISLTGGRKVIIVDEADYLNPESTQPAFRGEMEKFSENCSFIFTCNHQNRILDAIHSRCTSFEFALPTDGDERAHLIKQFYERSAEILKQESIPFKKNALIALIGQHFPDFRRIINRLQSYSLSNSIDEGILANVNHDRIEEIIPMLKKKEFSNLRKWVADNTNQDPGKVIREVYQKMYAFIETAYIPMSVVIMSKYLYQNAFTADKEINLMAFLTELMLECQFKA